MKTSERKTQSRLLRRVLAILEKQLGRRRRRRPPDPLETLLVAVLSDAGQDLLAARILEKLRVKLVDWNELRVTTPHGIEELIHPLPDAAEKALTIRRVLHKLFHEKHALDLGHFKRLGQTRLWEELNAFGGISDAVKARMLLKVFDCNILPVTEEIERLSKRIGLIESYLQSARVGEGLMEILPPKRIYSFYHLMSEHAETVCTARNYVCSTCVLNTVCARGLSLVEKKGDKGVENPERSREEGAEAGTAQGEPAGSNVRPV